MQSCQGATYVCPCQDFVTALSTLLRGTVHEKLRWTFNLYDINKDGYINKEVDEAGDVEKGWRGWCLWQETRQGVQV